jgi:copper chaperone CopZ
MTQLKLDITGMHCPACVRRVRAALEKTPGVTIQSVEVGTAQLAYDPAATSPAAIQAAVEKLGFGIAR